MCVFGKESHLIFRITTICAVRVCFDELSNGETVGRFAGGEREVLRHGLISLVILMSITSCAERFLRLADTLNNEFGHHYKATVPPSAGRSTPVMKLLSSDARNRTDG
jgi:hypothetical protein